MLPPLETSYLVAVTSNVFFRSVCVQGEMVLRNGIWTTDKTQHFVLQGLYFWNPGDLFLIANPLHSKQYFPHLCLCSRVLLVNP
jgi:hypothetical protein